MDFADKELARSLETADISTLDALEFGVISMTLDGVVDRYNSFEAHAAGLSPGRVLGKHFFTEVAPCTNNYLVASRFEECEALDEQLPYVFTLRMRPRPVELRLLKVPGADRQYVLVRGR